MLARLAPDPCRNAFLEEAENPPHGWESCPRPPAAGVVARAPSPNPTPLLLTPHFVFLHVPKTGGTFVRRLLLQHAPAGWGAIEGTAHGGVADIPAPWADLPRLAFVRNPYAWYVSWFYFQRERDGTYVRELSDGGRLDFATTMRRALGPSGPFADGDGPFTQALLGQLGPGLRGTTMGRTETLADDLCRFLATHATLPPRLEHALRATRPINASTHPPWPSLYDDELRALVRRKDAAVFDFFGYRFDDERP